jgi:helicase SWR1
MSPKSRAKNATPKLSKRALLIEKKLKTKPPTSLFDTDGDLSKHNIIEGVRRSRKRTTSIEESSQPKKKAALKANSGPKLIKNAKQKLLPAPKTPLDTLKNEAIATRLEQMTSIKDRQDGHVKELYHLELFQNMLDYSPTNFIHDVRYNKVRA